MHDWLVGLVLEVAVPSRLKVWRGPLLHLRQLLFSWTNLDTSLNAVSGKWASALEVPFIEDPLLGLGVTTNKVIETLSVLSC